MNEICDSLMCVILLYLGNLLTSGICCQLLSNCKAAMGGGRELIRFKFGICEEKEATYLILFPRSQQINTNASMSGMPCHVFEREVGTGFEPSFRVRT